MSCPDGLAALTGFRVTSRAGSEVLAELTGSSSQIRPAPKHDGVDDFMPHGWLLTCLEHAATTLADDYEAARQQATWCTWCSECMDQVDTYRGSDFTPGDRLRALMQSHQALMKPHPVLKEMPRVSVTLPRAVRKLMTKARLKVKLEDRAEDGFPKGWPRCMKGCGRPQMEGTTTCGHEECEADGTA